MPHTSAYRQWIYAQAWLRAELAGRGVRIRSARFLFRFLVFPSPSFAHCILGVFDCRDERHLWTRIKPNRSFSKPFEHCAPSQWPAYLEDACGEDANLRQGVELLLAAHAEQVDLAEVGRAAWHDALPTIDRPALERPGTQIGPYKLLKVIGQGGMGVVYAAQQTEPVERQVALKVIRPGMDTQAVIARFEAERQALAVMDHPNVAKVLDAGTTHSGRPYFVMELVQGVAITKYCDQHELPIRQRLELFISVCQAVQHAHQKGIIHRDIKPSNILVAEFDGRPVPKVIDFGVAKAIDQRACRNNSPRSTARLWEHSNT